MCHWQFPALSHVPVILIKYLWLLRPTDRNRRPSCTVCKLRGIYILVVVVVSWEGARGNPSSVDSVDDGDVAGGAGSRGPWAERLSGHPDAARWLQVQADLGLAPRTLDAYGRGVVDYLSVCECEGIDPVSAGRADVARYVRDLTTRPNPRGTAVIAIDSGVGLANASIQQRLVAVRLFYDYLVDEGKRATNPVGRGRYARGRNYGGLRERGLVPRFSKLPWIPTDAQWQALLQVARNEPIRNRLMLALAYDAALRREELCLLRTDDLDPAHRTGRIRAETTKSRRARAVPYSASTGELLRAYLTHRRALSDARGQLFLSESRRNRAQPVTLWTWSKVVRALALRADLPHFSTHTLRHLCLTDLARSGWELHAIALFAGHANTTTTLQYIHLSGRDLSAKIASSMSSVHAGRIEDLTDSLS